MGIPLHVVIQPSSILMPVLLFNSWVSRDVINFTGGQLQIDTLSSDWKNFHCMCWPCVWQQMCAISWDLLAPVQSSIHFGLTPTQNYWKRFQWNPRIPYPISKRKMGMGLRFEQDSCYTGTIGFLHLDNGNWTGELDCRMGIGPPPPLTLQDRKYRLPHLLHQFCYKRLYAPI